MSGHERAAGAGDDIDTFCRKCDLDLAHIILAMDGGRPKRVQCKTCHSQHAFRAPKPAPRATGGRRAARPAGGTARAERKPSPSSLERALEGRAADAAIAYAASCELEVGDVVNHPRFQMGVVQRCLADHKVEVLFAGPGGSPREPGTVRVLVHARRQN